MLQRALDERSLHSVVPLDDEAKYTFTTNCKEVKTMLDYVFVHIDNLHNVVGHTIDCTIPYNVLIINLSLYVWI